MIPTTKSKGKKRWEKFTVLKHGQKLPLIGCNMQGFLWTPWNATSRSTAQDALWQNILDRNRSSQPFMTSCACQIMNRIPGDLTPSWAGCWGPPTHVQWAEQYTHQHKETNNQQGRPPRPRPPSHPGKATPSPVCHWPAIWNHLHSEDSCGFQWRNVDAVTREFPLDLQNTSPEYFCDLLTIAFLIQSTVIFHHTWRNYWCWQDNTSTTFWDRSDRYPHSD